MHILLCHSKLNLLPTGLLEEGGTSRWELSAKVWSPGGCYKDKEVLMVEGLPTVRATAGSRVLPLQARRTSETSIATFSGSR